jgi:molecular chaperone GrpE
MAEEFIDDGAQTRGGETEPALQLETLHDRLLRALAEAENTRRRSERNVEEARKYAIVEFARELLVVADNLQRALEAAGSKNGGNERDKSLFEGVRSTERLLINVFERFGIRKIDALGKPFDPALHEAIMQVADATQPDGAVARVIEDGYLLHDRLLRPARVVVVKNPSKLASASNEGTSSAEPT